MPYKDKGVTRRDFFKTAGAAGLGSVIATMGAPAAADGANPVGQVPTRPFGKTGVDVPILSLGGMFDIASNQLLLRQAVKMGVTYWDTAAIYLPSSEKGIGKYFAKYPEDRKKVFLATKSALTDPAGWDYQLEKSLANLKTDHVDFFMVHEIESIERLEPLERTRAWVKKKKAEGRFRFFGFSTHKHMEACMLKGARLGWIDGMLVAYNYRNQFADQMIEAVSACAQAGIGLTAMKTQAPAALGDRGREVKTALQLADKFLEKGFTPEQARLKAVWENPHIASICSQMTNMTILKANVQAALDRTRLSSEEKNLLRRYAVETRSHFCTGCAHTCQSAVDGQVPVADLMRYLMYSRRYGQHQMARSLFNKIPGDIRRQMVDIDYSEAQRRCPQKLAIGALVRMAADELA